MHKDWGNNALIDANNRFSFFLPDYQNKNWFLAMPPPNITGQLHLGHAMFLTLQDIKTRFNSIIGNDTLWLPGTDHAGLATHSKIIEQMNLLNIDENDENEYNRIGWEWKEKYHQKITSQIRKMGASCDWDKERFTLDDEYINSTKEAFKRCLKAGLIYKKENDWYLDLEKLSKPLIDAINDGTLDINPIKSKNKLMSFLNNIEPWCISRQIKWGMKIPLRLNSNNEWNLNEGTQCEDTLDTWFLSSLWPFATLGWPNKIINMEKYYPSEWMETGEDILFFWCAKMWMMGYFLTGQWPFKKIFLHGLIRDKKNQKMSKSLGNGIDPLEIIENYGTDALRWHLAFRAHPALDMKFSIEGMKQDSSWLNKIWQAARFMEQFGKPYFNEKWDDEIIRLSIELNELLEGDKFPDACKLLQSYFRNEFCGKWIEENKKLMWEGNEELIKDGWTKLKALLSLLHPFIPHMTSTIHKKLF